MPKQTWVNIEGSFKKVINVWQNVNGVWKGRVMPKGVISGLGWKEFMQYMLWIYDKGTEYVPIEIKESGNAGSTSKKEDYFTLISTNYNTGEWGSSEAMTSEKVNLTGYNKVYMEYSSSSNSSGMAYFMIQKIDRFNYQSKRNVARDAIVSKQSYVDRGERIIWQLDVKDLEGDFYVAVTMMPGNRGSGETITGFALSVHKIWVE